jgi:DNA-directed RNA polymerase I subunit RPA2
MFPRECREAGSSYTAPLVGLVCVQIGDGEVEKVEKRLGKIPVMVRSARCNLRMLTRAGLVQKGEEASEFGGYFVINGIEKIIRLLVLPKRNYCIALKRSANAKRGASRSRIHTPTEWWWETAWR